MMSLRRFAMGLLAVGLALSLVATVPLGSSESAQAQQTPPPSTSQIETIFPGDAKFSDLENQLKEKTKLSGSSWVEEFKKHQMLGEVRSSSGLQGILFVDATGSINLLTGQVPFVVYGTISIPSGSKLGQKGFSGDYGIVILKGSLIIALIDLKGGSIGAFVVVPGDDQALLIAFFLSPLFSPVAVFQILFALITVPPPAATPPAQPQPPSSSPACLQDLPNKSPLNLSLAAAAMIVAVKDSSGAALFEIDAAPPSVLTVKSFGTSLQFIYTVPGQLHLGFIIGPAMQEIPLTTDVMFALWVTNGAKSACVQAMPKLVNGVLTLSGTLSTN